MSKILPLFRSSLEITTSLGLEGAFVYLIKDPVSKEVFSFGEEEYFLCQHLDGKTDLDLIQEAFQQRFGIPLRIEQLEAFVRHLETLGLVVSGGMGANFPQGLPQRRALLRVGDPDRFLARLASSFGWCFSRPFLAGSALLVLIAAGLALKYMPRITAEARVLWAPLRFFEEALFGIYFVNFLGEVAKALAVKWYGGVVHEFSVFYYQLFPYFSFDLSDAFWFTEKRVKLKVFSAGLICQGLLCAIGIIGWSVSSPWSDIHRFWFIVTVSALFFTSLNLMPLLKRDGYYLLSIWLEIPDLWDRARSFVRSWIDRKPMPEPLSAREIRWFKWFGSLSFCFEVIFWVLIFGLIGYLLIYVWGLNGKGACLLLVLMGLRFEKSIRGQFMKIPIFSKLVSSEAGSVRIRRLFQLTLLALFVLLMFIPYPFDAGGEFKVVPGNQVAIRASVPGEIDRVLVKEGQWITKGQPAAVLVDKDQKARAEAAAYALQEAKEKLALLRSGPTPEEVDRAKQEVNVAAKSLEYTTIEAERSSKQFKDKAISEKDFQAALKARDLDKEKLALAQKNLEVVKAWPRKEEVRGQEAEVKRLEADLTLAEKDLQLTTLLSPVEGRMITAYPFQKIGQYLDVGDLFAVVEDSRVCLAEIEIPEEDIGEVTIGAKVRLRTRAYPAKTFDGKVVAIAPVGYEKSRHRVERVHSEKELQLGQKELLREEGKVVRVLSEFPNTDGVLKTDMTGYAKIEGSWMPVGIAFSRWMVRFVMVEIWSWIP